LELLAVPVLVGIGLVAFMVIVLTKPKARVCAQCAMPNVRVGAPCPRCGAR